MRKARILASIAAAAGICLAAVPVSKAADEDTREFVKLPPMMQEHMLANMRNHLATLNEILGKLADGDVDAAAKLAEQQLGMSSLSMHGAEQLAQFMPEGMAQLGTQMHHAASQFVIVAQDAELNPGKESQHQVYRALQAITENCNACHQSYRIR